ncbi:hypothetical protein ACP4OV_010057 [Aristida adscensionis]
MASFLGLMGPVAGRVRPKRQPPAHHLPLLPDHRRRRRRFHLSSAAATHGRLAAAPRIRPQGGRCVRPCSAAGATPVTLAASSCSTAAAAAIGRTSHRISLVDGGSQPVLVGVCLEEAGLCLSVMRPGCHCGRASELRVKDSPAAAYHVPHGMPMREMWIKHEPLVIEVEPLMMGACD